MKRKDVMFLLTLVCLAMGLLALADNKKANATTNQQSPPVAMLRCPDIKVLSFSAKLVSTTAGDPGVEFPRDSILLTAELVNAGNLPITGVYKVSFFRKNSISQGNVLLPYSSMRIDSSPNIPNSLSKCMMPDTFPHGVMTNYTVVVESGLQECTKVNNKASFTINEGQLHAVQMIPRFERRIH